MSNWPDYDAVFSVCMPLIKQFEGFAPRPYKDVKGIPTIGYGTITYTDGRQVTMDDPPISEAGAEACLSAFMQSFAGFIASRITRPSGVHQAAAMLSLTYNIGTGNFGSSTVLRKFNEADIPSAADAFLMWNKIKKDGQMVPVQGLTNRRQAERAVFLTAD